VARDRKRARQRRPRPIPEGAPASSQHRPVRADLPGSLDHAGDVDEFDAAIVRGAQGVPVEQGASVGDVDEIEAREERQLVPADGGRGGRGGSRASGDGSGGDGSGGDALGGEAALPARRPSQPITSRAVAFLRASWAELQRVQWPDRRQVTQATAVVLGFVAVMGAYLGAADWVAQKIVNFIL
jgi:preprotein translocase subunit SecE